MKSLVAVVMLMLSSLPGFAQERTGVFVNAVELDPEIVHRLEQAYSTAVLPGRYWYDPYAGLWGLEGGPGIGQLAPGMAMGGALRADASGGGTGVFVNGREIHPQELAWLRQQFGQVQRGRYWLSANGVAGFEGGPPQFDLSPGNGASGYNRTGPGGGLMSDGECHGYLHPDGPSVLGGNC